MRRLPATPLAVVAIWASLWLATVPSGDIPLNDDWTYAGAVQSLLQTGRFTLLPWSAANAIAQVYWGVLFCAPFGFSYEALRLSTAVLGAVGVLATYGLLRELRSSRQVAALGALTLGCNPLYLSQSVTFMTDVPFVALVIVSLWLYVAASRRNWRLAGAAAYGVGLVAVLVRQFAVVLPIAFAAGALLRKLSTGRVLLLAGSILAFAGLHLLYQRWMLATHRTSDFMTPVSAFGHLDVGAAARRLRSSVLPTLGALGMGVLPFAAVGPGRWWGRRDVGWVLAGALAAAMLAALSVKHEIPPLTDNVLRPFGIGPLTLTDTYSGRLHLPTMPGQTAFWWLVSAGACWGAAIGALSGLALALKVWRGEANRVPAAMLLALIAAYTAALAAFAGITPLIDRYFMPLLAPGIGVIAMLRGERSAAGLAVGGLLVAAMACFSVLGTHDWLAWQRVRWQAVGFLEARGIPPTEIDGGYEFNGVTTYRPGRPDQTGKPGWWVVDNAYMLAGGPLDGFHEVASFPVRTWLWRDGARVVVLQRD